MNATTPNLHLNKPLVDGDDNIWGGLLNDNADTLDTVIHGLVVSGGGIPEAPTDGPAYGRQMAAWARVIAANNDVVDGGNF